MTHVNYAFGNIENSTGKAYLTDEWADIQKTWPGDKPSGNGTLDLFGNLKQLYLLKKQNRNLKTLLSIGGWSYRHNFAPGLLTDAKRQTFARTTVDLVKNYGFDGIDIDWEYPASSDESAALVDTCRRIRLELDNYARNLTGQPHFLLTLAVPAGPAKYVYFDVPGLTPYIDFMSLMAFDYMGSGFSNYSGHQANVYKSIKNPRSTDFDSESPVEYYLGNGLPSENLVLGMPLYGRAFADTDGPGTNFTPATTGSFGAAGVWDYKVLPLNNTPEAHDNEKIIAAWCYGENSRLMVSYDTPCTARLKAKYIEERALGGSMWWETSQDLPLNNTKSLIRTIGEQFAQAGGYAQSQNVLNYPFSKYVNLRAGMPGQ